MFSYYIMPFIIRKLPKQDKYKVLNKETKKVHSYHTTKQKALKQVSLLNSIIYKKKLTYI